MNEAIVITGEERIQAVRNLAQLRFWHLQAQNKAMGCRPRQGWTIATFNQMYQTSAKSWADILELTKSGIADLRREMGLSA